jgi:hypothetical protein
MSTNRRVLLPAHVSSSSSSSKNVVKDEEEL